MDIDLGWKVLRVVEYFEVFYDSQNLPLQQVPGANEDGRTTTRERQRGLDSYSDDIESETTTKMVAVQWRGLCIRGPGRKTKSLK